MFICFSTQVLHNNYPFSFWSHGYIYTDFVDVLPRLFAKVLAAASEILSWGAEFDFLGLVEGKVGNVQSMMAIRFAKVGYQWINAEMMGS